MEYINLGINLEFVKLVTLSYFCCKWHFNLQESSLACTGTMYINNHTNGTTFCFANLLKLTKLIMLPTTPNL